jgi:diguanylate cyclase (GGDEF)-like protein/PAS domain S-box-containing protein
MWMVALLLAFGLPFATLFALLLREIDTNISAIQLRVEGLHHERPLLQTLEDVLILRNGANARLGSPAEVQRFVTQSCRTVDRDMQSVEASRNRLDPALRAATQWIPLQRRWELLRGRLKVVRPQNITALFEPHNGQVARFISDPNPGAASLTSAISSMADASGLVLAADLGTYYFETANLSRLPATAVEIADISDVGLLLLARGSQSITNEEIRELDLRIGTVRSSEIEARRAMDTAIAFNPQLSGTYPKLAATEQVTRQFLKLVEDKLVTAFQIDISPDDYFQASQRALQAQFALSNSLSFDLDGLLRYQLTALESKRNSVAVFATLVALLTAGGFVVLQLSMNAREQAESSLGASELHNRLIVENAFDAIVGMNQHGRITEWNPSAQATFGWSHDEAVGRLLSDTIVPMRLREAHTRGLERFLATGEARMLGQRVELSGLHRDGHEFPIELKISIVNEGRDTLFSAFITDISERKHSEKQLQKSALFDALTDLPNRSLFMDRLSLAVRRSKRQPDASFTVLFIDLDHFKVVNDSMGHTVGDSLLVEVASRLSACLRPGDSVARWGGDEFTVLLEDSHDASTATHVAGRIQQALQAPFSLNGRSLFIAASIGIAGGTLGDSSIENEAEQLEAILRDADTAMYRAKAQGRGGYAVFDSAMHEQAMSRLLLETDLRQALSAGEFEPRYQPIVSLVDGHICGFEALIRWNHPERGLIAPNSFIPLAEETGLVVALDRWMLRTACHQLAAWQRELPQQQQLTMSVNLSGRHFAHADVINHIEDVIKESAIAASTLKIELTESAIVDNPQLAAVMLGRLKSTGVQLSLDDFGTGYSSLSYLHRFPFDTLKIDRSFVSEMGEGEAGEIVRTIVSLAHNLGLDVVAEGIETEAQALRLRQLSCEYGQGYHFARPYEAAAARQLLQCATLLPVADPHAALPSVGDI